MAERIEMRRVVTSLVIGTLPFVFSLVLNFLRPDLMLPMLNHSFGRVWVAVLTLLVLISSTAYLFATNIEARRVRIGVTIATFVLGTLPALLLVLFGPIVFAFLYGTVG